MGIKNLFKETVRDFIRWALQSEPVEGPVEANTAVSGGKYSSRIVSPIEDTNSGMNFTVFSATGGKIIRVHTYDPTRDRSISNLYIVTDKENLGEELGLIITKENLTR